MDQTLFNWVLDITQKLCTFGTYLTQPLPYINVSILGMFAPSMIMFLLGLHALRLVVGG